jgi:hypothetical protein
VREKDHVEDVLDDLSLTKLLFLSLPDELGEHSDFLKIVSDTGEILPDAGEGYRVSPRFYVAG